MQYFVVADVHSFYNELMEALTNAGWRNESNQCFVSLGDLCDRGPDTIKCLQFVNNLPYDNKILIRGNHEDLMQEAIQRGVFLMHDIHNRTVQSAQDIAKYEGLDIGDSSDKQILEAVNSSKLWRDYFTQTVDFSEVKNNIFVHGWIPCMKILTTDKWGFILSEKYEKIENWRKNSHWGEARWINGMEAWSHGVTIRGKTIWCGHWHASYGHSVLHHEGVEFPDFEDEVANFDPFIDKGIVAMDACTAFSHKVNCIMFEVEDD